MADFTRSVAEIGLVVLTVLLGRKAFLLGLWRLLGFGCKLLLSV
jgi:hypothetical protein